MVGTLLVRGMLVGIVAGLLAFWFAQLFGEPQIDRAIAFEEQMAAVDAAKPEETGKAEAQAPRGAVVHNHAIAPQTAEPELVSRTVQSTIGLLTGLVVYSAAFGGLFALVFAFIHGRVGQLGPRATAALLAGAGFLTIVLVPALKYPPNPPAVGSAETIGYRTVLFFAMLVISIAAMGFAVTLARRLAVSWGSWNAALIGGGAFVVIVAACQLALPQINEVPDHFSAVVLWQFRMAALGMQLVVWTTIGLLFGALTERSLAATHLASGTRAFNSR
jgi:predicted cobalt transporter CbtA